MLVLTRNINESIVINENIRVCILGIQGKQVRIGIEAPKHISIHRKEIQMLIDVQKQGLDAKSFLLD